MGHNVFKDSIPWRAATNMPHGLKHTPFPDQPFDHTQSEVIKWMFNQPEITGYLMMKMNTSGAIVFDKNTRTWSGKNRKESMKTLREIFKNSP